MQLHAISKQSSFKRFGREATDLMSDDYLFQHLHCDVCNVTLSKMFAINSNESWAHPCINELGICVCFEDFKRINFSRHRSGQMRWMFITLPVARRNSENE